jgi:16S rRNA (guanine966-N2)-methyltransferase
MTKQQTYKKKPENKSISQIRIIGGSHRGRKVSFMSGEGLRPTLAQVRETLFNWLIANISQANCLDLYAGSGAIGFEAISRGAKSVTLVDSSKQVAKQLKQNIQELNITNATVENQKAECFLSNNTLKYDIIFLDPPFEKAMLESIMLQIKPHLKVGGLIYIEQENSSSTLDIGCEWQQLKYKKTSRFIYSLYSLKELISE